MRYILTLILVLCFGTTVSAQEMRSVLITPHINLEIQRVQTQPQTQFQPQPQPQPQQQYIPQSRQTYPAYRQTSQWTEYARMQLWFNMNYEKRGFLFPRYVRRSPADTMQRYVYYQMMFNR